jgi:hypothetical protein
MLVGHPAAAYWRFGGAAAASPAEGTGLRLFVRPLANSALPGALLG